MKNSLLLGAVAVAVCSSGVAAQDVLVKRGELVAGDAFVADVGFSGDAECGGDYTFSTVPAPVVQTSPAGECVADASGLGHKATCSGSTVSSYTTFETRNCGGNGGADATAATCSGDSTLAFKKVCFESEVGGIMAKGRLYTSLNLCKTGDYFTDSVEYQHQYVPASHANKCMTTSESGLFVKHSCGSADGHKFTTYYSDDACTVETTPTTVMPGEVSTFGLCQELETDGAALVFEECVTFVKEGAGGRAELTGGLAVLSLLSALALLVNSN
jgi:hypothetical protein